MIPLWLAQTLGLIIAVPLLTKFILDHRSRFARKWRKLTRREGLWISKPHWNWGTMSEVTLRELNERERITKHGAVPYNETGRR